MNLPDLAVDAERPVKSSLKVLLEHLSRIEDPREPWRVRHRLPEILLLVVCGTIADCDGYEDIAAWGKAHLSFLRRFLPYEHGVPGARWLEIFMNRINPDLFAAAFTGWVRERWPEQPDFVATRRASAGAAGRWQDVAAQP